MPKHMVPDRYKVLVHHQDGRTEEIGITCDILQAVGWADDRRHSHVSVRNALDGRIFYTRKPARAMAAGGVA
jgi:hypothetical protein